jgi:hypothetical protein
MSWPLFMSLRSKPLASFSRPEIPLRLLQQLAARVRLAANGGSRVNVYLLASVISNESVNFLMVGGSDGLVNITITA